MLNGRIFPPCAALVALMATLYGGLALGATGAQQAPRSLPDDNVVGADFISHLPLLVLTPEPGEGGASAQVSLCLVSNPDGLNRPDDVDAVRVGAFLERDGDGLDDGKTAGTLRLVGENGEEASMSLLAMPAAVRWTIVGNSLDRGMFRNILARRIAAEIYAGRAPEARVCELLVKDDKGYRYLGLHLLSEYVPGGVWMSPRTLADKRALARPADGGESGFRLVYSEPDDSELADRLERITISLGAKTPSTYLEYMGSLDVDACVDAYVLALAVMNDPSGSPFYWFESRGLGRVGLVSLWDFTNSLDNLREVVDGRVGLMERYPWLDGLLRSSDFITRLKTRYFQLRRGALAPERLDAMVDDLVAELGAAADRDWQRWESEYVPADAVRVVTVEQEVLKIKHYLRMQGESIKYTLLHLHLREGLINTGLNTRWNAALAATLIILFLLLAAHCRNRF